MVGRSTLVYYYIPEDHDDAEHPNAFSIQKSIDDIRLADVRSTFPLPGVYHFRFKARHASSFVWVDVNNDEGVVPYYQSKIVIKVLRLGWNEDNINVPSNVSVCTTSKQSRIAESSQHAVRDGWATQSCTSAATAGGTRAAHLVAQQSTASHGLPQSIHSIAPQPVAAPNGTPPSSHPTQVQQLPPATSHVTAAGPSHTFSNPNLSPVDMLLFDATPKLPNADGSRSTASAAVEHDDQLDRFFG